MDMRKLAIDPTQTKKLHLFHPDLGFLYADDAQTKPVCIILRSPASDEVKKVEKSFTNESIMLGKRGKDESAEIYEARTIKRLKALTAGFENFELNGVAVDASQAEEIYKDRGFQWIKEDVLANTVNMQAFLRDWS